ncbi:antibiotic biosynthesis monooxygenase [Oscillatoria sp. FACHB-1407]|uniref:antibiotic biosynthesis monooxygenase n=1 Tax=Oscillatoria sp. FACHB-1407 TaxID=2692847 RepID=UPI0018EFA2BD|nr:antibiotic biosynthesis monooxygenase [Oscillatoria sp. FACHB-1407]
MQQSSSPITLVISEVVEPDRISEYETWTQEINHAAQSFEGFLEVEIIRPRDHDYPEYVIVVKFDNYTHLRNWLTSSTYQHCMDKSRHLISARSQQQLPTGLEMWFTLPQTASRKLPQPAFYKQVIVGVLAVYPLILLANALLGPFLKGLPFLLGLLISVTFVSTLLTYPVMPWLTKQLNFWLYPTATKRTNRGDRLRKR